MPYYLVKLRNTKCSSDSPVVMVSFVVLHICGLNSSSHLPNYLKGCIQYVKLPLLWGLEKVKVGSLYPQFFWEADKLSVPLSCKRHLKLKRHYFYIYWINNCSMWIYILFLSSDFILEDADG